MLDADLLSAGMDITIIKQILGHISIGTTEIYAEISQDGEYKTSSAYKKMNKYRGGRKAPSKN